MEDEDDSYMGMLPGAELTEKADVAELDEELFPMASWGVRKRRGRSDDAEELIGDDEDEEETYFGKLTCCQTTMYGLPNLGWYAMKFMLSTVAKIFYTDDYPRVSLSGIGLVSGLQVLLDIGFDPMIASWSDRLRSGCCGCGPFCGRRKPFLLVSGFLGLAAFVGLWYPPPFLSNSVPEADRPGAHRFWRVMDSKNLSTWAVREIEFFSQPNILNTSMVSGGVPLAAEAAPAFDGNPSTWALGSGVGNGTLGKDFAPNTVEILAVRMLQFENPKTTGSSTIPNATTHGILQYSDDDKTWSTAYEIDPALDLSGEWGAATVRYNSMMALFWYLFFVVLFKVGVVTIREIPYESLPVEMTPDPGARTNLFLTWTIFQILGTLLGSVLPSFNYFGPDCTGTAYDGCYDYVTLGFILGLLHIFFILCTSCTIKEVKATLLPPPEDSSIVLMFVQTWLNRPFRALLISDILEGFGAEVPMAVLPYIVRWVIGYDIILEQLGMSYSMYFAVLAGLHLISKVIFVIAWRGIVLCIGRYKAFLATNILYCINSLTFLAVGRETGVYLPMILVVTWAFASGGFWILRSMLTDVIDYDEFLSGQRREAQYTMLIDLLPKFAEVPGLVLPFIFMAYFGYNPTLTPVEQPIGVIWTLKFAFGLIPAIFTFVGFFILLTYQFKTDEECENLQKGLDLHRQGLPARDPIWRDSIVPVTCFREDSEEITYGDRVISKANSTILQHFFPSELQSVLDAGDLSALLPRQICTIIVGIVLLFPGIAMMVYGWEDLGSKLGVSITPIGLIIVGFALYLMFFGIVRLCKARQAMNLVSMEDVETQAAMYEPYQAKLDGDEEGDEYDEYEQES